MAEEKNILNDEELEPVSGGSGYDPTAMMCRQVKKDIRSRVLAAKKKGHSNPSVVTREIFEDMDMYEKMQKKYGEKYLQVGGVYLDKQDVIYYINDIWFN